MAPETLDVLNTLAALVVAAERIAPHLGKLVRKIRPRQRRSSEDN